MNRLYATFCRLANFLLASAVIYEKWPRKTKLDLNSYLRKWIVFFMILTFRKTSCFCFLINSNRLFTVYNWYKETIGFKPVIFCCNDKFIFRFFVDRKQVNTVNMGRTKVAKKTLGRHLCDLRFPKRYRWKLIVNNRPPQQKQWTDWSDLCRNRFETIAGLFKSCLWMMFFSAAGF